VLHNQKKQIRVVGGMSTPRADWLLGLPLTQNSRHVVSTFKRLTLIGTHRDLNQSVNTDGVSFLSMILHITPSVILIVMTELKITNSYIARVTGNHPTSKLAEHLCDKDSGTMHWFLGFMHLGFHFNS
jgi:hypothetical protein